MGIIIGEIILITAAFSCGVICSDSDVAKWIKKNWSRFREKESDGFSTDTE